MVKTKKRLSAKAIRLLRRTAKHILAEPRRYDQNGVGTADSNSPCGTVACIGGWIDILKRGRATPKAIREFLERVDNSAYEVISGAAKVLGFEPDELDKNLFGYSWQWPEPFKSCYADASTPEQRARIAAARIEHFIKTDGAE